MYRDDAKTGMAHAKGGEHHSEQVSNLYAS